MKKRLPMLIAFLMLSLAAFGTGGAQAAESSAKFDYHIADAFIAAATEIPQTGARARADNGDTVSVTGSGTFNTASMKATGGGTFEHRDSEGALVGGGTWTATGVESFAPWGCGGGFPPNFCGGLLVLDVHLVATGGAPEADGVLTVSCLIGARVPAGAEEGITLEVPELGINFDELIAEASGLTLYRSRSKS